MIGLPQIISEISTTQSKNSRLVVYCLYRLMSIQYNYLVSCLCAMQTHIIAIGRWDILIDHTESPRILLIGLCGILDCGAHILRIRRVEVVADPGHAERVGYGPTGEHDIRQNL